VYSKMTRLWWN